MSNITSDDLINYDDRIKQYIQEQIYSATSVYEQQIIELTNQIEMQQDRINELESSNSNSTNSVPLVRSIKPSSIVVQEDIEEDYIIYDRIISPNENAVYKNIVVTSDNLSNRLWFSMWKTFDDRDLTDKDIYIVWINSDDKKGESVSAPEDRRVIGDRLYFSWDIPGSATYIAGPITFAIRIVAHGDPQGEQYAWHTLPYTIECVQGLLDGTWDELEPAMDEPGWVDYIEGKYAIYIITMTQNEYTALEHKDGDALYIVTMNDHSINMYLGDTLINTGGGGGGGTTANFVQLTSSEYSALGDNVDPDTLYLITD